jgi:D-aminoacyl-tRNA deacylase
MKFSIVYSEKDEAGVNIAQCLKEYFLPQANIIKIKKDSIYAEELSQDKEVETCEFIIFATRHISKAGVPSLSVHAPGNWRQADFGGKSGKISLTSSLALKYLFRCLNKNAAETNNFNHKITLECTHHGPLINKPCFFIEIGSNEEHWKNKELGSIIAKTIFDFQGFNEWLEKNKGEVISALAIGGPHYCPNFNSIQLNNDKYAIGHIIPEYCFPVVETMIKEAIEKTKENLKTIIIDWKGCGNSEQRSNLLKLIEKTGLSYIRADRL